MTNMTAATYNTDVAADFEFGVSVPFHTADDGLLYTVWHDIADGAEVFCIVEHDAHGDHCCAVLLWDAVGMGWVLPTPSSITEWEDAASNPAAETRYAALNILARARNNADDTAYEDPTSDWGAIALASLKALLTFEADADTIAWFAARGLKI